MTKTSEQGLYALGLQRPRWVYFQGDVRPREEATLHVSCEAVTRGLNVYEGLKGYWQEGRTAFGIVGLREQYERLTHSARLLRKTREHSETALSTWTDGSHEAEPRALSRLTYWRKGCAIQRGRPGGG